MSRAPLRTVPALADPYQARTDNDAVYMRAGRRGEWSPPMSAEAVGWVWTNSPLRGAQLLVHLAIADVVNDAHDQQFYMSTYRLAEKARVSRSTVVTALAEMCDLGLLRLLKPGGTDRSPAVYRFLMTRPTTGLARPMSGRTRPIHGPGLGQPPRDNSKIELKELRAFDQNAADEAVAPPWTQLSMTYDEWKGSGCPVPVEAT